MLLPPEHKQYDQSQIDSVQNNPYKNPWVRRAMLTFGALSGGFLGYELQHHIFPDTVMGAVVGVIAFALVNELGEYWEGHSELKSRGVRPNGRR